ncbi:MAG TPA: GerMN domain-containing protein [Clostridiaceae bacterium]|nr:GerMN domain-containing protein [Clostridiaceae bacterium]
MKRILAIAMMILMVCSLSGCWFWGNKDKDDDVNSDLVSNLASPTPKATITPYNPGGATGNTGTNETSKPAPTQKPSPTPAKQTMTITVYYQDSEGCVIPAARVMEKQIGVARASINATIDNSVNRESVSYYGLYPILPKDTEVLGINIKGKTAIIDFNNKVLNYSSEQEERNIISAIVYSLTEFDTIDDVRILVNGYEQGKLKYGTDISGLLDRSNCMINNFKVNLSEGVQKSDIYVYKSVNNKYNYLVPVSVEHTAIDEEDVPAKLVALLSSEYSNDVFFSELPASCRLIDSTIRDDLLELDFNSEIKNYTGSTREKRIINQIYHTMKQIDGVNKIKILIEGATGRLPEGTNISQTVYLPKDINLLDN